MGLMRFLVAPPNRITAEAAERAYLIAQEQVPYVTRVHLADNVLNVSRDETDSASLCIPYPVTGRGEIALTTATLIERFAPYHLSVELARGKLNQLRSQITDWQAMGLTTKPEHDATLREAMGQLARAVTLQHDVELAAEHADKALSLALDLSDTIGERYVAKIMAARRRQSGGLTTLLGANLGHSLHNADVSRRFLQAFNTAAVPVVWRDVEAQEGTYQWEVYDRQVEWCQQHGVKVVLGPLIQFDNRGLPDWLAIWQGDFENTLSFVSDYVETVVHRYRGKVAMWQCASRVNVGEVLGLGDEDRLRLAVRAFEIARNLDPGAPAMICFDQPWGEFLRRAERELTPIASADILIRSGVELSAIGIELNIGYSPDGTYARDCLEYSRMLDQWASLGPPLWLFVTAPSAQDADAHAYGRNVTTAGAYAEGWTPESQRQWVRDIAPMLLAKPAVQGIIYNNLTDHRRHELPHSGLFDEAGTAKPALATWAKLRKQYLEDGGGQVERPIDREPPI